MSRTADLGVLPQLVETHRRDLLPLVDPRLEALLPPSERLAMRAPESFGDVVQRAEVVAHDRVHVEAVATCAGAIMGLVAAGASGAEQTLAALERRLRGLQNDDGSWPGSSARNDHRRVGR